MTWDRRRAVCLGAAVALIVVGTLATGVLPSTAVGQTVAGAVIVAGFGLVFHCLGAVDPPSERE